MFKRTKKETIKFINIVGLFSALSIVLYAPFARISLPFLFPSFLKIQFSLLPIIIGGFVLGPWGGFCILLVRTLATLPSTNTFFVGEFADFVIGFSVMIVTSLIYYISKTRRGSIIALTLGTLTWIVVAILANYFVLIPFYIELYFKGSVEGFVGACSVIPNINIDNYKIFCIIYAIIPFNLLLSVIVHLITFVTYKRISYLFYRENYN